MSYAAWCFERYKKGITYSDLTRKYGFTKAYAQHRLKGLRAAGMLFAPEKYKPRKYYALDRKADVIKYLNQRKDVLIQSTDTDSDSTNLQRRRAQSLLEALQLSGTLPQYCHNLRLETTINKEYYDDIEALLQRGNKAKKIEHRIDGNNVNIFFYRNGKVQVQIACTNTPFKIETFDDELNLLSFIGYIRGFLCDLLADRRGVIVPKTCEWWVVEYDINIDVPITDTLLQTFPSIQIFPDTYRMQLRALPLRFSNFMETLRIYTKSLGREGVMRLEELRTPIAQVPTVVHTLFHPNAELEKKVDYLIRIVDENITGRGICGCPHLPSLPVYSRPNENTTSLEHGG